MRQLPLTGTRVLDFGWQAVAPISARTLGWYGAEVIRIESVTRFGNMRALGPFPEGQEGNFNASGFFNNFNSNKLAVALNLGTERGKDIARRLVAISDVVIENFRPGAMERLGLGYDDLIKIRPDIIMIGHGMMGRTGPWNQVTGHGPNLQAMAGLDHITGYSDREPIGTAVAHSDYIVNPFHSSYAVLAAIFYRKRTRKGQYLDLSQYESTINCTGPALLEHSANRRVATRQGNRVLYAAPYGVYPCAGEDAWCAISVLDENDWGQFCSAIDRPDLECAPNFATLEARKANEDELDRIVSEWTVRRTPWEAMEYLQHCGIACGAVQHAGDLLTKDHQMSFRQHYHYPDHPEAGRRAYDGPPFRLHGSPPVEIRRAPLLGEHNSYVYRDLLGLTDEELTQGYVDSVFL